MRSLKRLCVLMMLCGLLFVGTQGTLHAATKTWDGGGGDGLWTTAANWNNDTLPVSGDDVTLDNSAVSGNYTVTLNAGSAQTVRSLQIGYAGNANTTTLIVSGNVVNVLTVNGGGATALHVQTGGVLSNQSSSGTRGILLSNAADVFKMSGNGTYIHATSSTSSKIPQRTSGTTSANYDFASTSIFELQTATFDATPAYGTFKYNVNATNSAAIDLTITGDLNVAQGTFGVCAISTSNTFNISGNVSIASGATFRGSNGLGVATINIAGDVTGSGTFQGSTSATGATTHITIGGSITAPIHFHTQTTSLTFSGGASNINFTPANGTLPTVQTMTIASGKTITLGAKVAIATLSTLTIDSGGALVLGAELANSGTVAVNGTLQINNGGLVSGTAPTYAATSLLKYNSGGTYARSTEWSATSGAGYPGNVQLGSSTTLNLGANSGTNTARQIAGSLTIDNGSVLEMAGANAMNASLTLLGSVTNNGTLRLSSNSSGDLNLAGNFSNSGTFTHNGRTVTFNGSGTQNLVANTTTAFQNLTVNNSVVLVETVSADNVSVSGTLTNNGTIRKAQSISGTGFVTFGLAGAHNGAHLGIDVTAQGTLSNVQIDRVDSNHSNANVTQQTGRYWSITATGSNFTTNLTLPRSNTGTPSACRYLDSGTNWSCGFTSYNSNTVTRNNVTGFSDWSVGNDATTAADLLGFNARVTPTQYVRLKWETGTELNTLGFNLYRQTVGVEKWVMLNTDMIPARDMGGITGSTYIFTDKRVHSGKTYRYKVEVIKTESSAWSDKIKINVP